MTTPILSSPYLTVGHGTVRQAGRDGKLVFQMKLTTTNPNAVKAFAFVDDATGIVIRVCVSAKGLGARLGSLEAHPTGNAVFYQQLRPYLGKAVTVLDCTVAGAPVAGTRLSLIGEYGSVGNAVPKAPVALNATDHTVAPVALPAADTIAELSEHVAAYTPAQLAEMEQELADSDAGDMAATDDGELPELCVASNVPEAIGKPMAGKAGKRKHG